MLGDLHCNLNFLGLLPKIRTQNVGNISQNRISRPIAFCRTGHMLEKPKAETVWKHDKHNYLGNLPVIPDYSPLWINE